MTSELSLAASGPLQAAADGSLLAATQAAIRTGLADVVDAGGTATFRTPTRITADAGWLSAIALCYLVVINAVANGCRLAMRDAAPRVDWASNLAHNIAAAAAGTATLATKPARRARQRRVRPRTTKPRLAAVPA